MAEKLPLIERILDRLFERRVIVNCDRDPYLNRWYVLRTKRVGIFIHKFVRSDEDRALHDHPWPFLVIPIWRGYVEHSECNICQVLGKYEPGKEPCEFPRRRLVLPILGTRYRRATYRHRVQLHMGWDKVNQRTVVEGPIDYLKTEQPAWSIFFRFTETRTWGFWLQEGFVAWNKWWQDKCE